MNFRTTIGLFAVLGVMIALLAYALYVGPESPASSYLLGSMRDKANPFPTEDVRKITIERKKPSDAALVFERDSAKGEWRLTEPRPLPADNINVNALLTQLHGAKLDEETRVESLSKAGLDAPQRVITLEKDGRKVAVNVGVVMPGQTGVVFVTSSDAPTKPQAVSKEAVTAALENLPYFRGKDLLGPGNQFDIQGVKLTLGKKAPVELKKDRDQWKFVDPAYGEAELGTLLTSISDLRVGYTNEKDNDFVADNTQELEKYFLDPAKADVLKVEVTRKDEGKETPQTYTAYIGVSKKVAGLDKKEDRYYAYSVSAPGAKGQDVVRVDASKVDALVKVVDDPGSLRDKTLVKLDKSPDAVDVVNSYGTLSFRRADSTKPWELYRDGPTGSPVEDAEAQALITALTSKDQIKEFPDPKRRKELGLEKPEATVTLWADSLEKPDDKKPGKPAFKKDVKPGAVLKFGVREKGLVAVERTVGDTSTLVMLPEVVADLVRKGPLAYVDKTLPGFAKGLDVSADVTKVVIDRKGTAVEVTREKPGAPWKLVKPAKLAGRDASAGVVEGLLGDLNRLKALEIAAEKATPDELGRNYDLKAPPYKVTITTKKDDKPATVEYLLGKESADKKGYYLKQGDRDAVFVVGRELLSALDRDLLDPTLFKFDVAKVQTVKLTGWKKLLGSPASRVFEQKDGKWVAKEPADFALDAPKLADFVGSLSRLQAEKFVPSGRGLSLAQDGLEIEIKVEGQEKPLQLLIGAEEGASFFASSKQLEGDTFLLPKVQFEGPRGAPGYFSAGK